MSESGSIRAKLEQGFSLLEVLITVVVVSIGMLGLAGMQFAGLRSANSAQEHTLAVNLLQDIEERIHANQQNNNYGGITLDSSSTLSGVHCDSSNNCDPASLLNYDKDQWIQMIKQPLLPNLVINITSPGAPFTSYTSTLTWGNSDNQQTLTASFVR